MKSIWILFFVLFYFLLCCQFQVQQSPKELKAKKGILKYHKKETGSRNYGKLWARPQHQGNICILLFFVFCLPLNASKSMCFLLVFWGFIYIYYICKMCISCCLSSPTEKDKGETPEKSHTQSITDHFFLSFLQPFLWNFFFIHYLLAFFFVAIFESLKRSLWKTARKKHHTY